MAAGSWGTIGYVTSWLPAATDARTVAAARMLLGGLMPAACALRPTGLRRALDSVPRIGLAPAAVLAMAINQAAYFAAIAAAGPALTSNHSRRCGLPPVPDRFAGRPPSSVPASPNSSTRSAGSADDHLSNARAITIRWIWFVPS